MLGRLAAIITAMTSSSGGCERNWSSYDYVHSKKRNRLTAKRANDLVYVFSNMRLAAKMNDPAKFPDMVGEVVVEDDDEPLPSDLEYESGSSSSDTSSDDSSSAEDADEEAEGDHAAEDDDEE